MNCSQLSTIGCWLTLWLSVVGYGCRLSRASLWLSHDIAGCQVLVFGFEDLSGVVVTWYCWLSDVGPWALCSVGHRCDCHMILEVVGCRSFCFGICRVLLSAAVVGCRLSVLACRAQVVDCRVSSSFVAVGFWLSGVDCWVSVADCRCMSPIYFNCRCSAWDWRTLCTLCTLCRLEPQKSSAKGETFGLREKFIILLFLLIYSAGEIYSPAGTYANWKRFTWRIITTFLPIGQVIN